jgi:hypothetical protein
VAGAGKTGLCLKPARWMPGTAFTTIRVVEDTHYIIYRGYVCGGPSYLRPGPLVLARIRGPNCSITCFSRRNHARPLSTRKSARAITTE